jgi:26S proteasome regulatory subunit (ATPase 3-interacting protein)
VYHTLQDQNEDATAENLAAIDGQIATLREETNSINAEIKTLRARLSSLESEMPTSDLRTLVVTMEMEKEEITARLVQLRSGDVEPVSMEEKAAIDADMKKWEKIATNRAKISKEMWDSVLEVLPEDIEAADLRASFCFLLTILGIVG